eukprot:symbB.v1.2.006670.t1/scaffold372.1/size218212/22
MLGEVEILDGQVEVDAGYEKAKRTATESVERGASLHQPRLQQNAIHHNAIHYRHPRLTQKARKAAVQDLSTLLTMKDLAMAALLVAFVLQVPFARGTSVLQPLSVERPDEAVFPLPEAPRHLPPFGTEVTGAKATNKFWANWVVEEGRELSIHPMPYVLRYDESTGSPNMRISRSSSDERVVQYGDAETNGAEKIRYYFSPFVSEFGLGAIEGAGNDGQVVVKEGLFGIHAEVRGPVGSGRKIVFPIYSGMSYVSGLYSGFTPKITSDRALLVIERVSNGIWRLLNNGGKEFRLYAVDPAGNFADETFDFHSDGRIWMLSMVEP